MSLKNITTAIYYQNVEYIFRIHKFKVIIKIKVGEGFFFLSRGVPGKKWNVRIGKITMCGPQ